MRKATLFAPSLVALLLGCTALSSAAQAGWFSSDSKPAAASAKADDKAAPPAATLDDSIRQAQMLRLAGSYSEALNHLSQLMLVAADDPRVVSEYGKTLVSMGRADEAEKFLTRAQQLQPGDWTIYSALGVAYDQMGNQQQAQVNYERALALKPGDPSVLSNYALSRMLAKDPAMGRKLADRAEAANAAAKDDKITRNIAMIRSMAPEADATAVNTPAPPVAAPHVAVATTPMPPVQQPIQVSAQHVQPMPVAPRPAPATMAPRPVAANTVIQAERQVAPMLNQQPRGVVMQAVPVDPLAGPIQLHPPAATHAPRTLQPVASDVAVKPTARPDTAKPAVEPAKPLSTADSLEARAEAIAKTLNKPGAIAQAQADANKAEANKETVSRSAPAKPAAKPVVAAKAPAPVAPAAKVSVPVKAADVKATAPKQGTAPAAPKVLPPASVKAADAKPATTKTAAAKPKDAIPGLRMSANAY